MSRGRFTLGAYTWAMRVTSDKLRCQKAAQSSQTGGSSCAAIKISLSAASTCGRVLCGRACSSFSSASAALSAAAVASAVAASSSALTSETRASAWAMAGRVQRTMSSRQPSSIKIKIAQTQLIPQVRICWPAATSINVTIIAMGAISTPTCHGFSRMIISSGPG